MQAERISIAVLVIASFIVAATHAQGQTIAPSADSFIRAVGSDANEGTTTFMRLQNSGDNRTLVRFDQAAIAAAVGAGNLVLDVFIVPTADSHGDST